MFAKLYDFLTPEQIQFNADMKQHTSFKIGGPADILVLPACITDLVKILEFCREKPFPYVLLGQGSNVLVRDKGIRGMVIKLGDALKQFSISGGEIYAEAGISLSKLAREAAEHSLSGLEFAEGIPGSLGGALAMNAGAYQGEMKDVVHQVIGLDGAGNYKMFNKVESQFGYRSSIFQDGAYIVVAARLHLKPGQRDQILSTMQNLAQQRQEKQPLEYPSAGSTFRRPPGFYVGPLIEGLGLKGFSIGGAQVSIKHAGFIINKGQASAQDVIDLIRHIQQLVREQHGVELKPEIKILGEE
ncbi:MAG: UDP-N-acetylmuramate dehydrogenase [Syntrophomonadaceae bacterium]|jgi:UDP-N-acetylmuramate dehydrogenase|nr:UDP-N-acetylmuramate dehydrogenase [Syntrophomonadaceae bacterium]